MTYTNTHHILSQHFRNSSEISEFLGQESRLIFNTESLKNREDKKQSEKLTVGQEAVSTHEKAERKKGFLNAKKNPLLNTSLDIQAPDEKVNQATENREKGISAVLQKEDHKKVSALIMGNIPKDAGEKIAGSIMNDY